MKQDSEDFYVYVHRRKDDGVIFYVGKGRRKRLTCSTNRSISWNKVVENAGGFVAEKYLENLSEEDALLLELSLIKSPPINWVLVNKHIDLKETPVDYEEMNKWFYYDPSSPTGLRWKIDNKVKGGPRKRYAGDIAGGVNRRNLDDIKSKNQYYCIRLGKNTYSVHRIIWVLHGNALPNGNVVNHIDNNSLNNNIDNLECVTQAVNSRRTKLQKNIDNNIKLIVVDGIYYYAQARWSDLTGKRFAASIPLIKYGKEGAIRLAREARETAIRELNTLGAGYK